MSTGTLDASETVALQKAATTPAAVRPAASPDRTGGINEFLTFRLGGEEYGIDILRVQEIRSFETCTHIANAPAFMLGVINLRGVIVPIIDMRLRFQFDHSVVDESTVTIVLALEKSVVGIVVDAVSDVITLSREQMRQAPAFSSAVDSEHILAIGTVEQRMLILIDIVKLMAGPGMGLQD
jgi:purine-binding chemotaxis protein CheW